MDTMSAYSRAMAAKAAGNKFKTFDWDKAAELIVEKGVTRASAGLSQDWEWTGGLIFENGKPVPEEDTYVYLHSIWATPELDIGGQLIDCWKYSDDPGHEYWPESALKILGGE